MAWWWGGDPKRVDRDRDELEDIPYAALTSALYRDDQVCVPFLGAGASAKSVAAPSPPTTPIDTSLVAKVCDERGVPWSVVRAISDRASDGSLDPEIVGLSHPDGRANFSAAARYLVRHPGAVPRLIRLARGSKLATTRAADAAIRAIS